MVEDRTVLLKHTAVSQEQHSLRPVGPDQHIAQRDHSSRFAGPGCHRRLSLRESGVHLLSYFRGAKGYDWASRKREIRDRAFDPVANRLLLATSR